MSDPAGGSDHLTGATTQSRQYEDERMERHSSQAKQDAGNPGLDVAAGSTSPTCAGDDHEQEVLEHRPPDGSDNGDVSSALETDYESSSSSSSSDVHAQRSRLLAISNSLSKEEVKQIKFLAKHEISNDRYAQISKAYEVFGELEKDGKFPIGYIAQLLVEVKRNDLALKLGIAVPLTQEEEGQAGTSGHSLSARRNDLPAGASFPDSSQSSDSNTRPDTCDRGQRLQDAGSQPGLALSNPHSATHMTGLDVAAGSASPTCAGGFTAAMGDDHEPEVLEHRPPDAGTSGHSLSARRNELPAGASVPDSSQSSDSDTQPDTHDRGRCFRKRTSCSSRNCEQLQSSEEEYILSTSDETDDSQISSSISSPDSASEIGGAGAHSDQLLTSSTVVTSPSSRGSTIIPSASSQPPGYQERLGARPRQIQQSASREPVPEIPVLNDGLCSDSESSDSEQLLALQQKRTFFNQILQRIQERREQLSRGQRSIRERGNQRGREIQEALRRPQQEQEEAIPRPQLYTLWFPCCMQYYPCSSCHSRVCDKTRHVTHLTCSHYMYHDQNAEQQNDGGSEKTPSHNCVMCNKCFNPQEETHLCEPDECCQCSGLLDAFSGCRILSCGHKIHEDCAIAMIQNGIHTCPICQRPIFDSPG